MIVKRRMMNKFNNIKITEKNRNNAKSNNIQIIKIKIANNAIFKEFQDNR